VAWIYGIELYVPDAPNVRKIEVRESDQTSGRSASTLLDSGRAVSPRSLAIRGSMISWKNAGQLRTATLR
jgi:hypothetical protein